VFHPKFDVAGEVFKGYFDEQTRVITKQSLERFFRDAQHELPPDELEDEYDVTCGVRRVRARPRQLRGGEVRG
jgi:hypothetical protein